MAAAATAAACRPCRLLSSEPTEEEPQDRILLRGLVFHGYHGVYPEVGVPVAVLVELLPHPLSCPPTRPRPPQENKLGQKFVVDATLSADLSGAGRSDDLGRTVNYARVYE